MPLQRGVASTSDDVMSYSSAVNSVTKRPVTAAFSSTSRDLGILGLPPERMALVREKKEDIEKVCYDHTRTMTRGYKRLGT